MKTNSKKLDKAMIGRLYEWGGLYIYRVSYFDPILFKTIKLPATFNEDSAKETIESYKRSGFAVALTTELVKFDGAFNQIK